MSSAINVLAPGWHALGVGCQCSEQAGMSVEEQAMRHRVQNL